MARSLYLVFGVAAYLVFFATFLALVAFVANVPQVSFGIDRGVVRPAGIAIAIDVALIALFGIQHSVMARKGFKAVWTRAVPASVERSVYVLLASFCLILLIMLWRPLPGSVWSVASPGLHWLLWGLFGLGWLIVFVSTFLINHFELFGLQQVWAHARDRPAPEPVFRTPLFYARVRHPLYAGFILAFWATPAMSFGHALLAVGMTVYILIAIHYEERDLVGVFGADYVAYRGRAGMLIPKLGRSRAA
jgi:protein-S-isoprenylcysteine O-methyltransferase Ste14